MRVGMPMQIDMNHSLVGIHYALVLPYILLWV